MIGEFFAALTQHTILGRLIIEKEDLKAFAEGIHYGFSKVQETGGIRSRLFGERAMSILGMMGAASIKDYLSILKDTINRYQRYGLQSAIGVQLKKIWLQPGMLCSRF
jgi:hypothetical protein